LEKIDGIAPRRPATGRFSPESGGIHRFFLNLGDTEHA